VLVDLGEPCRGPGEESLNKTGNTYEGPQEQFSTSHPLFTIKVHRVSGQACWVCIHNCSRQGHQAITLMPDEQCSTLGVEADSLYIMDYLLCATEIPKYIYLFAYNGSEWFCRFPEIVLWNYSLSAPNYSHILTLNHLHLKDAITYNQVTNPTRIQWQKKWQF
jgi:hypothetical protein